MDLTVSSANYNLVRTAAGLVIAIGVVVLVGWACDLGVLKSLLPELAEMKANTATGFVLAGLALLLLGTARSSTARRVGLACALLTVLLGLLTLGEYLTSANFGIDQLLFSDVPNAVAPYPGRPGPNTVLAFVFIGVALLIGHRRETAWLAQMLTIGAGLIALASSLGYVYDQAYLTRFFSATQMAIHTSVAFLILCIGLIAARPSWPLVALLSSRAPGGILLRRMLPQAVLILVALGWLELQGEREGAYQHGFGVSLLVVSGVAILSLIVWRTAGMLNRADDERRETERAEREADTRLRITLRSIGDAVISTDVESRIRFMNAVAEEITGWRSADATGRPLAEVFSVRHDLAAIPDPVDKAITGGNANLPKQTVLVLRDGRSIPIDESVAPVLDEAGNLRGEVLVFRDITQRKIAEQNTRFLLEINRSLAELSDTYGMMKLTADQLRSFLDVAHCVFVEFADDGKTALVQYDSRHELAVTNLAGAYRLLDYIPEGLMTALAAGSPLIIDDVRSDPHTVRFVENYELLQTRSYALIPYVSKSKLKYSLGVIRTSPHKWTETEIKLVNAVADHACTRIERARSEDALRRSEEDFRQLAAAVPEIIWVFSAAGSLEYVNAQWTQFSGLGLKETTREILFERIHPDDRDALFENGREAFIENSAFSAEARMMDLRGEYRHFLIRFQPFKNSVGVTEHWFGSFTDISEIKEAQAALQYQLNLNRTITDNAQSCLWMIDVDGRCTFANPASERISGFKRQELIGEVLHHKVHHSRPDGSHFPMEECPLERALPLNQAVVSYEDRFIHKDGHFYPVRCAAHPIFKGSKPAGTVIEVQDITEEKRLLQDERRARETAEKANRLKDDFLATLSHELRTPLSSIIGWIVMLRSSRLRPEMEPKAMESIERNARTQHRLIEDLLDVSRIVTGKMQFESRSIHVAEAIESAVASVHSSADAKNIHLDVALESRTASVLGDPFRLQQIVWHLLSNGIKFTPPGGRVGVRLATDPFYAYIVVKDTGEGIPQEFLPYTFNRFTQADTSSARRHGGLGLGLALVRHLTELHGGSVSVSSPGEGQGATFTVKLPLVDEGGLVHELQVHGQRGPETPGPQLLGGVSVLVVDDEPDARALLQTVLSEAGADVRVASSKDEALTMLEQQRPAVLVSDIAMPGGDGLELIKAVRNRDTATGESLPAVALTAYAHRGDQERAIAAGFQLHLAKPVEPDELLRVVVELSRKNVA